MPGCLPEVPEDLLAMTEVCPEQTSCSEGGCECSCHCRGECGVGKIAADLVERERALRTNPNRQEGKPLYQQHLVHLKGSETLTLAESYTVAKTEAFRWWQAVLYPEVRVVLSREASSFRGETPLGNTIWRFKDGSTPEERDGLVHTAFLCPARSKGLKRFIGPKVQLVIHSGIRPESGRNAKAFLE